MRYTLYIAYIWLHFHWHRCRYTQTCVYTSSTLITRNLTTNDLATVKIFVTRQKHLFQRAKMCLPKANATLLRESCDIETHRFCLLVFGWKLMVVVVHMHTCGRVGVKTPSHYEISTLGLKATELKINNVQREHLPYIPFVNGITPCVHIALVPGPHLFKDYKQINWNFRAPGTLYNWNFRTTGTYTHMHHHCTALHNGDTITQKEWRGTFSKRTRGGNDTEWIHLGDERTSNLAPVRTSMLIRTNANSRWNFCVETYDVWWKLRSFSKYANHEHGGRFIPV